MSAPYIIPFNNNPSTVSVKTTSYTIPAGKYGYVYVEADSGGIFTINAVNAVVTAAFANIDVSGNSPQSYTTPTGFRSISNFSFSVSGQSYQVNGNIIRASTTNEETRDYSLGPGGTMVASGTNGGAFIQGVAIPSNATNRQATFWVPTGTVISGSGNWKAVVQEYNVIS